MRVLEIAAPEGFHEVSYTTYLSRSTPSSVILLANLAALTSPSFNDFSRFL